MKEVRQPGRDAEPTPGGTAAETCENRAPAVHTATQPFQGGERVKAEFLFDFGSPNAYIAHTQVPGIESRTGVTVEYVPVLLGGVFKLTGNVSPIEGVSSRSRPSSSTSDRTSGTGSSTSAFPTAAIPTFR